MGAKTNTAPKLTSSSEIAESKDTGPVLLFDTSLSISEWVKMGITLNIDLQLLHQLCGTVVVTAVVFYTVFWSVRYGKDYLAIMHRYFTRRKVIFRTNVANSNATS